MLSRIPLLVAVLLVLPPSAQGQEAKLSKDEQTLVDLVNKERAKAKLPPLKINALLMKAARDHSANMAKTGMVEHVIDGDGPAERVEKLKYKHKGVGENLGGAFTVPQVLQVWMESKIHRETILDKEFTEIGVGFAPDPKVADRLLFTLVAATPGN